MYQEKLKQYDELGAQCTRFERKGKSMPYTSANGYMVYPSFEPIHHDPRWQEMPDKVGFPE